MKFCWSTLYVKDIDKSLKFYQEIVGLKLNKKVVVSSDMQIAFLGEGETQIELIYDKQVKTISIGEHISWGFVVNSIKEKMDFLKKKNIKIARGPFQPNPYARFFFIKDPNGMNIQFFENIKP